MTSEEYKEQYSHGNASASSLPEPPEEIRGNAKEVFISYSTKNPAEAAFVCEWLEANDMRCWIAPRDLSAGTNFADNIELALGQTKMLVLVLSKQSADSPWVEGEINTAFSAKKPILVFQIDDVEPTGSMRVMLMKFPRIRACGDYDKNGFALVEMAQKLLGGIEIVVNPREREFAGTPKTAGTKKSQKSFGNKCLILTMQNQLALAQRLAAIATDVGGNAKIVDVERLSWVGGNELPKNVQEKIKHVRLLIIILSQEIESVPVAQAIIKFAFSVKKSILPYKIYAGKPSAGLSLMLGMAHWLDVSTLANPEDGTLEFRNALGVHFKKKSFGVWLKIFAGTLGIVFLVLLSVFSGFLLNDFNREAEEIGGETEQSVPAETENVVPVEVIPAENDVPVEEPKIENSVPAEGPKTENSVPAESSGNGEILVVDEPRGNVESVENLENVENVHGNVEELDGDKNVVNSTSLPVPAESENFEISEKIVPAESVPEKIVPVETVIEPTFNERWEKIFPEGLKKGMLNKNVEKDFEKLLDHELVLIFTPTFAQSVWINGHERLDNRPYSQHISIVKKIARKYGKKITFVAAMEDLTASREKQKRYKYDVLVADSCSLKGKTFLLTRDGEILYRSNFSDLDGINLKMLENALDEKLQKTVGGKKR